MAYPNVFQHDKASVHKVREGKVGVEKVEWPAQRSDLNCTEHLWDTSE